jgi:CP family cyanate transporter-like MFS transporter
MGLFAPPAPYVSRRLGLSYALGAALALIGVFGLARALVPGAWLLILPTFPVGIGMGIAGALLPVWVKERFSDRPAFATGVYGRRVHGNDARGRLHALVELAARAGRDP